MLNNKYPSAANREEKQAEYDMSYFQLVYLPNEQYDSQSDACENKRDNHSHLSKIQDILTASCAGRSEGLFPCRSHPCDNIVTEYNVNNNLTVTTCLSEYADQNEINF